MKEKEEKYLNAIYQNIRTAIQSIEDIMPKSTDENLTSELSKEQDEYNCLAKECEAFAKAEKIEGLKDNNLIYQSLEDIAKSLNLSKSIIEIARGSSKAKVIKNMIVGNNLDNLLWTNFTDEFITRDNFSHIKSINIFLI